MASLVPALLSVMLTALYFIGVDTPKDLDVARNSVLLAVTLWMVVNAVRSKMPRQTPADEAPLLPTQTVAASPPSQAEVPTEPVRDSRDVLSFLGLLQQKGRLLDFLMDDISRYEDAQIGAAARVVHQGAGAALREYFDIKPVAPVAEGDALTLGSDYDANSYRLIGRVVGEPPYRGQVLHRGWLTTSIKLPELHPTTGSSPMHQNIITPAEVELT